MDELKQHARRELEILGEDEGTIVQILKIVEAFEKMDHSGYSAEATISILERVLRYENLAALTSNPAEWSTLEEDSEYAVGHWQNIRNSAAFSRDGGKSWVFVDDPKRIIHTAEDTK